MFLPFGSTTNKLFLIAALKILKMSTYHLAHLWSSKYHLHIWIMAAKQELSRFRAAAQSWIPRTAASAHHNNNYIGYTINCERKNLT